PRPPLPTCPQPRHSPPSPYTSLFRSHGLAALDLVDVLHALAHLAPDRVLPIEEARVVEADEELRIGAVRALRPRHRGRAPHVRLDRTSGVEGRGRDRGADVRGAGRRA